MAELTDHWNNRAFLRDVQYRTDANLAARQSIYAYQHPRIDLQARVIDLAAPAPGATVADVGCGNGAYLAELAGRGFAGAGDAAQLADGLRRFGHVVEHVHRERQVGDAVGQRQRGRVRRQQRRVTRRTVAGGRQHAG
jgi:SAM-dependent methyltransferase